MTRPGRVKEPTFCHALVARCLVWWQRRLGRGEAASGRRLRQSVDLLERRRGGQASYGMVAWDARRG